ncbi:MAG: hypothetical protein QW829_06165 [Candidatus Bathyarchaeia archaeon]
MIEAGYPIAVFIVVSHHFLTIEEITRNVGYFACGGINIQIICHERLFRKLKR